MKEELYTLTDKVDNILITHQNESMNNISLNNEIKLLKADIEKITEQMNINN